MIVFAVALSICLLACFWLIVVLTKTNENLRRQAYDLEDDLKREVASRQSWTDMAHESNEAYVTLLGKLSSTERMLDLALQSKPGNFNHVVTELGLNGVVYQFNRIEESV